MNQYKKEFGRRIKLSAYLAAGLLLVVGWLALIMITFMKTNVNANIAYRKHLQDVVKIEELRNNIDLAINNCLKKGDKLWQQMYFDKSEELTKIIDETTENTATFELEQLFFGLKELHQEILKTERQILNNINRGEDTTALNLYSADLYQDNINKVDKLLSQFSEQANDNLVLIKANSTNFNIIISIFAILSTIIAFFIIILMRNLYKKFLKPLAQLNGVFNELKTGNFNHLQLPERFDEFGNIFGNLKIYIENLKNTAKFAAEIGKGNSNAQYKSLGEKDILGNSLIEMQTSLLKARQEEKNREIENQQRNWGTAGIAKFSDILRKHSDNLQLLSDEIIKNLVDYVEAQQGGLFLANDEKPDEFYLEMLASYAYDRKKFIEKQIELGEGLVGTCALERKTIHMTEIPEQYIEITSGLGHTIPKSLLIIPLKIEDKIFGVIELAALEVFPEYKIKFIERLAESIASTLSNVKINAKTAHLLSQTRQQAEEMAAQEEEMRQNLEELVATQEASARKEAEISGQLQAINKTIALVEYKQSGNITEANDIFCRITGYSPFEIKGKNHKIFVKPGTENTIEYRNFWTQLRKGHFQSGEFSFIAANNEEKFLSGTYYPMVNNVGEIEKILMLAFDITQNKKQREELIAKSVEMQKQQQEVNEMNEKLQKNQISLESAIARAQEKEKEAEHQTIQLEANEEELKQTLEEMQTIHEGMNSRQEELENENQQLKIDFKILQKNYEDIIQREKELMEKINQMRK